MAIVDAGSAGSFNLYDYAKGHKMNLDSATGNVTIASSSVNFPVKGTLYQFTRLYVLHDICCDMVLDQDFMSQHSEILFAFDGTKTISTFLMLLITGCCLLQWT